MTRGDPQNQRYIKPLYFFLTLGAEPLDFLAPGDPLIQRYIETPENSGWKPLNPEPNPQTVNRKPYKPPGGDPHNGKPPR